MPPPETRIDFDVFVALWNNAQRFDTPQLHVEIAHWLQTQWHGNRRELLLMAFRNSGKSTLVGLFSAWLLKNDPDLRIMVLAADLALARKMVRNVKRIIERHPLTRGLRPPRADQWASDQFTVNRAAELRDPSMLARGIGANVTGSRADVIICDDVEVPNTCDTAAKRADLRARLTEIEYVLVPGGLQLYVGTPHTHDTIYAATPLANTGHGRPFLAGFERLELPLLSDTGASRWPERFPQDQIDALKQRSGPNKFKSQMLLQPVNIFDSRLDPDRLIPYDGDLVYAERNGRAELSLSGKRLVSASCWWDPAYGAPGKGDASVVACVFTGADGTYFLHDIAYLEHDPHAAAPPDGAAGAMAPSGQTPAADEATQMCRQVVDFLKRNHLPSVTLETNGLGRFLPGLLRREVRAAGLDGAVVEVSNHRAKDLRIVDAFDAVLAADRLWANRRIWSTPFVREMREWRPGGKGADDGLDAVSGCLLAEPVRLVHAPAPTRPTLPWRGGPGPFRAKTDFAV